MLPILPAIGAGAAIYRSLKGSGGSGQSNSYSRRFDSMVGEYDRTGRGLEERYLSGLEGFDPSEDFAAATRAQLDEYDDGFARRYASALGGMVGRGRSPSRSGYGLQDAQEMIRQGQGERAGIRERLRGEYANARLGVLDRIGSYGQGMRQTAFGAVNDRMNTLEAQRLQDAASRRQGYGALAGGVLQAIGSYAGSRR